MTTSSRAVADALEARVERLEPWSDEETLHYLEERLGPERLDRDPLATHRLLSVLSGLPADAAAAANLLDHDVTLSLDDASAGVEARGGPGGWVLGQLSEDTGHVLQALASCGIQPFSLPWACELSGRRQGAVLVALAELAEWYLVQEVETGEGATGRYQLDGRVARVLEPDSPERLEEVAVGMASRLALQSSNSAFVGVLEDLPLWRKVLDALAAPLAGRSPDIADPGSLTPAPSDMGRASSLPVLLDGLGGLLRYDVVGEAMSWIWAAARVVKGRDPLAYGQIAGLMAWQLAQVERREDARRWAEVSAEAFWQGADVERAVGMALLSTALMRGSRPRAEVRAARLALLERTVDAPLTARAQALGSAGIACLGGDAAEVEAGRAEIAEALALVTKAPGDVGVLSRSTLVVCRAVLDAELGADVEGPDEVRDALRALRPLAHPDAWSVYRLGALGPRLGIGRLWSDAKPAHILLGCDPKLVRYRLGHLYQAAVAMQPIERIQSRSVTTPTGVWTFDELIDGPPHYVGSKVFLELAFPNDAITELLSGDGLTHALRFCRRHRRT